MFFVGPIPYAWVIEVRTYGGNTCDPARQGTLQWYGTVDGQSGGFSFKATLKEPNIGSVDYGLVNRRGKKREEDTSACTSRQKADVFGLADGTRYNITTMDE